MVLKLGSVAQQVVIVEREVPKVPLEKFVVGGVIAEEVCCQGHVEIAVRDERGSGQMKMIVQEVEHLPYSLSGIVPDCF
jgi:hypothetical protein